MYYLVTEAPKESIKSWIKKLDSLIKSEDSELLKKELYNILHYYIEQEELRAKAKKRKKTWIIVGVSLFAALIVSALLAFFISWATY